MTFVYLKLFLRPKLRLQLKFECFKKWLKNEGKGDALYNLLASNQFSKLMKDRNCETFKNGLSQYPCTTIQEI